MNIVQRSDEREPVELRTLPPGAAFVFHSEPLSMRRPRMVLETSNTDIGFREGRVCIVNLSDGYVYEAKLTDLVEPVEIEAEWWMK